MATSKGDLMWTPLDVFTWVAFGEQRSGPSIDLVIFPRGTWWGHWPPQCLMQALEEIETGTPWQPESEEEACFVAHDRIWARELTSRGHTAAELMAKLELDLEAYRLAADEFEAARKKVTSAVVAEEETERLDVWARPARGPNIPDPAARIERLAVEELALMDLTLDEAGWLRRQDGSKKLHWDQVRFRARQVRKLWPALDKPYDYTGVTVTTSTAERRLQYFLEAQMRASPEKSPGKKVIRIRAGAIAKAVSGAGFKRAWIAAIESTGAFEWSRAGAKSKRIID